jgi:GNAT superfamily N-acetyltransferase
MWVSPAARGLGVGRRILEKLEALAREFGLNVLRLETNRTLKEAEALDRKCGYLEVERFNDEPYAHHWFEKTEYDDRDVRLIGERDRSPPGRSRS